MFFAINHFYYVVLAIIAICIIYSLIVALFIPLVKQRKVKKSLLEAFKDKNINIRLSNQIMPHYIVNIGGVSHYYFIVDNKKNADILIDTNKNITMFYENILKEGKAKIIETKEIFSLNETNKFIVFTSKVKSIKIKLNEKESKEVLDDESINNVKIIDVTSIKSDK